MQDKKLLDSYPLQACSFDEKDGLVTVSFVYPKRGFIEKMLFRNTAAKPYKVDLDEIGSFIWKLCDGSRPVSKLIDESKKHFGEKIEPAEERVVLFVQQLFKNKFVQVFEKK